LIVLANPRNAATDSAAKDIRMAMSAIGQQIAVLNASDNHEIDAAFTTMAQKRTPALLIIADPLFTSRRVQLVRPAARMAAFRGRIPGYTRTIRGTVRFFSLAPRAPSIHGTSRQFAAAHRLARYRSKADMPKDLTT
jgi:hypothetical protein